MTADALRQIRGGHPWVYADSVVSTKPDNAPSGSLAVIFDDKRRFAAIGLWDSESPIRVRVLHRGSPRAIDDEFWLERIAAAQRIRAGLRDTGTTGYRVVHGENDGLGGLIVDRYADTIVVKIYTTAWLPHLRSMLLAVTEVLEPERIVVRLGRLVARSPHARAVGLGDGLTVFGAPPDGPIRFTEAGLAFEADVITGQKTGHFFDQRENRIRVASRSRGCRVLDVFSSGGGFAVHAAVAGATRVHCIDISGRALAVARRNLDLNVARLPNVDVHTTEGDAFEVMSELGRSRDLYDVVIVDPPAFAKAASERRRALASYRKLAELGLALTTPGGLYVQASCSTQVDGAQLLTTVEAAADASGRRLEQTEVTGAGIDHPVTFTQGRYLDAVFTIAR